MAPKGTKELYDTNFYLTMSVQLHKIIIDTSFVLVPVLPFTEVFWGSDDDSLSSSRGTIQLITCTYSPIVSVDAEDYICL